MAISLPNFLAAPLAKPDYSGIGDAISNYYGGKALPKDDLIKAIQAQFARPNAEQALLGSQLTNRKSQLEISKLASEIAQQREFENQLRQAYKAGGIGAAQPQIGNAQVQPGVSVPREMTYVNNPMDALKNIHPELAGAITQNMTSASTIPPSQEPSMANSSNVYPAAPTQNSSEMVIAKGTPSLAGVDMMYENNPLSRALLEKKGFKKEVKRERDKRTGEEIVYTTYPSGKITKLVLGAPPQEKMNDIPLTKKSLNDSVKQVRATDAIMPYIDELIRMGEEGELPHFSYLPTDANAQYHRVASEGLDKYMVATGLNATDKSLDTIKDIIFRAGGESTKNYIKGLKKAKANKVRERALNVEMINNGLKRFPDFGSDNNSPSYSSDEWDKTNG